MIDYDVRNESRFGEKKAEERVFSKEDRGPLCAFAPELSKYSVNFTTYSSLGCFVPTKSGVRAILY